MHRGLCGALVAWLIFGSIVTFEPDDGENVGLCTAQQVVCRLRPVSSGPSSDPDLCTDPGEPTAAELPPYLRDAAINRDPGALGASGAVNAVMIVNVLLYPTQARLCGKCPTSFPHVCRRRRGHAALLTIQATGSTVWIRAGTHCIVPVEIGCMLHRSVGHAVSMQETQIRMYLVGPRRMMPMAGSCGRLAALSQPPSKFAVVSCEVRPRLSPCHRRCCCTGSSPCQWRCSGRCGCTLMSQAPSGCAARPASPLCNA